MLDLGLEHFARTQVRLAGIGAPEVRGESRAAGLVSRDRLRSLILGKWVLVRTDQDKREKFGRLLGRLLIEVAGELVDVNDFLVGEGLAVPYLVERDGTGCK